MRILFAMALALGVSTTSAAEQKRDASVADIESEILVLSEVKSDQAIGTELWLARQIYELTKADSGPALEVYDFAKANPKIIFALCELADHPLAKGNEDVTHLLFLTVRPLNMDLFLEQLMRPELSTNGVMNMVSIFKNWVIRDPEMIDKILPVLLAIRQRYTEDGYLWKFRWGTRRYSDKEESAVLDLISKIRTKTLGRR